jgi:hypothetical protein
MWQPGNLSFGDVAEDAIVSPAMISRIQTASIAEIEI